MKRTIKVLSAFTVALAFVLPSFAQMKELPKQTVTVAGTVETIDKNKHLLQIKTADGKFVALDVPASAKRFDELKVGDKVKATYNNNVLVRVKAPGEAAIDSAGTASTMSITLYVTRSRTGSSSDSPPDRITRPVFSGNVPSARGSSRSR